MSEVTVTFTTEEARALLPQRSMDQTPQEWNRRMDRAEEAHAKIKAALREVSTEPMQGQEAIL